MNIINIISLFLLITPIYWVLTDIKIWKIKNYFIYPLLLISFILIFYIENFFYNKENIIWIIIIVLFSYLFYKNNKWWAWDWKYLILIWINSIIISFLKWFQINIINYLFLIIFSIIFIYNIIFLFLKIKNLKNKKFNKIIKFNLFKDIWIIFLIYSSVFFISKFIWNSYKYISIFLFILLLLPIIKNIKSNIFYYIFILLWFWISIYNKSFYSLFITWIIFFYF